MTMTEPPHRASNVYDRQNIATMEAVYGEGFLSPGGSEEVMRIVAGLELDGRRVLDLGCGLGGATLALARNHAPEHVTGVDIDAAVLERAEQLIAAGGVADRVTLQRIDPGRLPFEVDQFDVVYANSVTCHFESLERLFGEVFRVLAPGGCLIGAEWFVIDHESSAFVQWDALLRERGLSFYFVTQSHFTEALHASGFAAPTYTDRSSAISALVRDGLERIRGPLREHLCDSLGEKGYRALEVWAEARGVVFEGGMRHCHFRATKPAATPP